MGKRLEASIELDQETDHGITDRDAWNRVVKGWARIIKDQNERACRYLAKCLIARLCTIYPELKDETGWRKE
jgi:hypothetical protein